MEAVLINQEQDTLAEGTWPLKVYKWGSDFLSKKEPKLIFPRNRILSYGFCLSNNNSSIYHIRVFLLGYHHQFCQFWDLFGPKNFHFCMGIVSIWIILHRSNKEFKRYHVQSRTQFHNSRTQFVMCQVFGKCWPVVIIQWLICPPVSVSSVPSPYLWTCQD